MRLQKILFAGAVVSGQMSVVSKNKELKKVLSLDYSGNHFLQLRLYIWYSGILFWKLPIRCSLGYISAAAVVIAAAAKDLLQNNSSIKDLGPRIATNEKKKSSLLIAGRMTLSRSRGKTLAVRRSLFPLADQAREKSVKMSEDSWIKALILIHLFCSEP